MTNDEKALFMAILAMDSYNRGYGSQVTDGGGVNDPDGLGPTGQVGSAVVNTIANRVDQKEAGFFAVSYNTDDGAVIAATAAIQNSTFEHQSIYTATTALDHRISGDDN